MLNIKKKLSFVRGFALLIMIFFGGSFFGMEKKTPIYTGRFVFLKKIKDAFLEFKNEIVIRFVDNEKWPTFFDTFKIKPPIGSILARLGFPLLKYSVFPGGISKNISKVILQNIFFEKVKDIKIKVKDIKINEFKQQELSENIYNDAFVDEFILWIDSKGEEGLNKFRKYDLQEGSYENKIKQIDQCAQLVGVLELLKCLKYSLKNALNEAETFLPDENVYESIKDNLSEGPSKYSIVKKIGYKEKERNSFNEGSLLYVIEDNMDIFKEKIKKFSITNFTFSDCGFIYKIYQKIPSMGQFLIKGLDVKDFCYDSRSENFRMLVFTSFVLGSVILGSKIGNRHRAGMLTKWLAFPSNAFWSLISKFRYIGYK
jgi:hypothetical protein